MLSAPPGPLRPVSPAPLADLYLAWDAEALYLGLLALDPVEGGYYKDGRVPEGDRMEWTVDLDGLPAPIHLRIGAGRASAGAPAGVEAAGIAGDRPGVRAVAALRVPASVLGGGPLEAGRRVRLASALTTHARAHRVEWRGEFPLGR